MSVLEDQRRIGDDNTESVEPNSKVVVLFYGLNIHGQEVSLTNPGPTVSIEWIGKSLWWGGTSFNATAPVFFNMIHNTGAEWRYSFVMIGYASLGPAVTGKQFLCVEASIAHGQFSHDKKRYCIPRQPTDGPGLARRRFPRRRLIPTPDRTGLSRDACKR